jgi:hypothetical protein
VTLERVTHRPLNDLTPGELFEIAAAYLSVLRQANHRAAPSPSELPSAEYYITQSRDVSAALTQYLTPLGALRAYASIRVARTPAHLEATQIMNDVLLSLAPRDALDALAAFCCADPDAGTRVITDLEMTYGNLSGHLDSLYWLSRMRDTMRAANTYERIMERRLNDVSLGDLTAPAYDALMNAPAPSRSQYLEHHVALSPATVPHQLEVAAALATEWYGTLDQLLEAAAVLALKAAR